MTYSLLVSRRSARTGRWLAYRVHSVYFRFRDASLAGDMLLNANPCNSLRVKVVTDFF